MNGIDNPVYCSDDETAINRDEKIKQETRTEEELSEGPYAWGSFSPTCLQCCNRPSGFLLWFCILGVIQGMLVNGLVNISISTIEKRYDLRSSLTGLISSSYDISFCILCLFVSFHGQRGHKPRWMTYSAFMLGLGSLVFSFPHYISDVYSFDSKKRDLCSISGSHDNNDECSNSKSSRSLGYLFIFILGQLIMGAGGTAMYTLGLAFIDESVPSEKSSLYLGIANGMAVLGPAVGYIVGGQFLRIYIDINKSLEIDLTQDDPRWLGGWWIPFLLSWPIVWLLTVPFLGFPKYLPGTAMIQKQKVSQAHQDGSEILVKEKNLGKNFKDFPLALKLLLKNKVFMCLTGASCFDGLLITSLATFMPKYIENQYGRTSNEAALLGGLVLIPGAVVGQVAGGLLCSKLKLKCRSMIKMAVITSTVSLLLCSVFFFTKCENSPFAGVSVNYNGLGSPGNLSAPCNAGCECDHSEYSPVCGEDNIIYFSPCHAGCKDLVLQNKTKVYFSCSCISHNSSITMVSKANAGVCPIKCSKIKLFITFSFLFAVFNFMASTPTTTATLRSVPEKQCPFALGVQWIFIRLLGSIPGPIILGAAMDYSCILWVVNACGMKGACWAYDNHQMALSLMDFGSLIHFFYFTSFSIPFCFFMGPTILKVFLYPSIKTCIIHFLIFNDFFVCMPLLKNSQVRFSFSTMFWARCFGLVI
uniref:Solute carrier organic anion transporter family member n=1 Tax=Erpetoichthys calabaricus TaxID=27687 RepID=A0A8C4RZH6_ERPCA